jgi:3-hydroxybutyryl-CoA dehydrogenase
MVTAAAPERIAIIGAGLMGHGLALVFAQAGHRVRITDPVATSRDSVLERVSATLASLGKDVSAAKQISVEETLADAVHDADIVIEAAPEKLELKQAIFAELETHAPTGAILASNTSVIPIGQIVARIVSKHRVAGTHWWNPPYLVPLVEVIETEGTSPETITRLIALLKRVGKTPVHVKKDVPGFVGNRLQHALWREAIALVAEGVCDAETVDLVVKNSFGRRLAVLGPLENADLVGTDLTLDIHRNVLPHIDRTPGPNPFLEKLVAEGKLGFKSGQGFRIWSEGGKAEVRTKVLEHLKVMSEVLGT